MIRPPPLQLKYDNRFPVPLKTPSKSKSASFASQLYKANWKNTIIAVAGLNGLRYAFAVYNAIVDATIDKQEVFDDLFKVSLALAVIYLFAFFIEVYGIISVSLQRLSLIRGYLYMTLVCSALVTFSGIIQGIAYFAFAEDIVKECASLAKEGRGYEKSMFRSRPWPNTVVPLNKATAQKHCTYAWVHQSWSQVASVFLFFLVPAVVYYLLVYTYYRQTTDPNHPANLQHTHSPRNGAVAHGRTTRRTTEMSQRRVYRDVGYSRLANPANASSEDVSVSSDYSQGLTTSRLQAAPAAGGQISARPSRNGMGRSNGPGNSSNNNNSNPFATKGIKRPRRPPPLVSSPSPLGLNNTPGAPAYGPSRVYAAFAAPVGSAGYDKFV
jgi:hypothetical protein